MLGFCHLGKPSVCRHAQIKPCSCHFSAGEERHNTKAFPRNTSKRVFLFFLFPKYSTYFAKHFLCMLLTAQICFATFFCKSPPWWWNVQVLPNIQIRYVQDFFQVTTLIVVECKSVAKYSDCIFCKFFASQHFDGGWTCYCRQLFWLDFLQDFLHVTTMMVVDCVAKYSDWIFAIHHHGGSWICKCYTILRLDFLQDFLQVTTMMVVECVGVAKCWDWIENFNGDIRLQPNGTR